MYETIIQEKPRTFKEIDECHTMICIEDVSAITLVRVVGTHNDEDKYSVEFWVNGIRYRSDEFDTEEEALNFRNEIMGWEEK